MEDKLKVIEALANGINPLTGEMFSADSVYNSPEIIRSLFATLDHVKDLIQKVPKPKLTLAKNKPSMSKINSPKMQACPGHRNIKIV